MNGMRVGVVLFVVLALGALVGAGSAAAAGEAGVTAVRAHRLTVRLDPATGELEGEAWVTLEPGEGDVRLLLGPAYEITEAAWVGKGEERAVEARLASGEQSEESSWDSSVPASAAPDQAQGSPDLGEGTGSEVGAPGEATSRVWVVPRAPSGDNREAVLRIVWAGRPGEFARAAAAGAAGAAPEAYLGPRGVFLPHEAFWYPTGGQRLSLFRMQATAPPAWGLTITAGVTGEHLLPGVDLVGGACRSYEKRAGRTTIAACVSAELPPAGVRRLLTRIAGMLDTLTRQVGPFPWSRLSLAEERAGRRRWRGRDGRAPGGVLRSGRDGRRSGEAVVADREAPGLILLPAASLERLAAGNGDAALRRLLVRQWFGEGLYPLPGQEAVLDGIALYLEQVEQGPDAARAWRRRQLELAGEPWRGPDAAIARAMQLHMLERRAGREAVLAGLRRLVDRASFRAAGRRDLEAALTEAAGGMRIRPFLRAWRDVDPPLLTLAGVSLEQAGGRAQLTVTIESDRPAHLSVPVLALGEEGRRVWGEGLLNGRGAAVSMRAEFPLREVIVDPEYDLWRRLSAEERTPRLGRLRAGVDLIVVGTARGLRAERQARHLGRSLFGDTPLVIDRELTPTRLTRAQRVLVISRPAARFWEVLGQARPPEVILEEERLGVSSQVSRDPEALLEIALPHGEAGRGALVIADALRPDRLGAALAGLERWPDAGWVVSWQDGERASGSWSPPEDPLRRALGRPGNAVGGETAKDVPAGAGN